MVGIPILSEGYSVYIIMQISILPVYSVISFVSISAKFGICTVVGINGTLV
jgi:hypothetical protein